MVMEAPVSGLNTVGCQQMQSSSPVVIKALVEGPKEVSWVIVFTVSVTDLMDSLVQVWPAPLHNDSALSMPCVLQT